MDFFSHALLPYLLGNSSRLKKEDLTAFVVGGIAPDIDVFIIWVNLVYPNFFLITHRGITHSLFFGFFTGIVVLYLATRNRIKSTVRRYIDFEPLITRRTVMFAYAGVVIHLFLDYVTTRGVPLYYPLSPLRHSAEVFFYTDIYLTILSLIIIIYLYKKPMQRKSTVKFLLVFLVVFAGLGSLRIEEKNSAEAFFSSAEIKTYPTMSPFDWYALEENSDTIKIYDYKGLERKSTHNQTFSRLNIMSSKDGLNSALDAAGELPQIKMFKWGAYSVAVNASSNNGTWSLEYYDPLQRAMIRDASSSFRRIARGFGSVNVTVKDGKAVIS